MAERHLHVGTSGWIYKDWDGVFYPREVRGSDRLSYYAARYDTVEVNATFYRFPTAAMLAAWNRRLDPAFHLVVKGSRIITHRKKLRDCQSYLHDFLALVGTLSRLKVILWQLPPNLHRDTDRLEEFLAQLPTTGARHAVEFRHPSWWDESVRALLARYRAAFVAVSHPALPQDLVPTTDFLYVRFHGLGAELYRYLYSAEELQGWVDRLQPCLPTHHLYIYFNNDYDGHALTNAVQLRGMLGQHARHDAAAYGREALATTWSSAGP